MSDKTDDQIKKGSVTSNDESMRILADEDAELEGVAGGWPNYQRVTISNNDLFDRQ